MPHRKRRATPKNLSKLQKFIRDRRVELKEQEGFTQADLAKQLPGKGMVGKTPEFIAMIEMGVRKPDLNEIPDFARALRVPSKALAKLAIKDVYPNLYQVLFGKKSAPKPKPFPAGKTETVQVPAEALEFWDEFRSLPEDIQSSIQRIVRQLYLGQTKD